VDFLEKSHPDMIPYFSSCKSPHQIVGVLSKTYYAKKRGIDPADIFVTSIMPCTAKKHEIGRSDEMFASGHQDIDISLTTRELARMLKQSGVDFASLPDEQPDDLLGQYSGAGVIFGNTGGVMEAAVRTAYNFVTGEDMGKLEIADIRGLEGVKEAKLEVGGEIVRIAVAHGLKNVEYLLEKVRAGVKGGGEPPYHFIEVMACAGGCVGGGGQPYGVTDELRRKRMRGLYAEDEANAIRYSYKHPAVERIYKEFLGKPLGKTSEELLHTEYRARPLYVK